MHIYKNTRMPVPPIHELSSQKFKNKLLSLIRPPAKPVFSVYDPEGLAILTQLRVGLSALNLHKFRHNFKDTIDVKRHDIAFRRPIKPIQ